MTGMATLRIDIWSDIACPWCYVGKRRLEAALAKFPHAADPEVVWHAFELDPSAPRLADGSIGDLLAKKYRVPRAQADAMMKRTADTATSDGLDLRFDQVKPSNTFDAHRIVHLGLERGVQDAVKERLFRLYFTEGGQVGDPEALVAAATEAGLDATEVRALLASDRLTAEVRKDETMARELGITGVPFFVLGGRLGVSGAQPAEVLLGALDQAWAEASKKPVTVIAGDVCGPDGCD